MTIVTSVFILLSIHSTSGTVSLFFPPHIFHLHLIYNFIHFLLTHWLAAWKLHASWRPRQGPWHNWLVQQVAGRLSRMNSFCHSYLRPKAVRCPYPIISEYTVFSVSTRENFLFTLHLKSVREKSKLSYGSL